MAAFVVNFGCAAGGATLHSPSRSHHLYLHVRFRRRGGGAAAPGPLGLWPIAPLFLGLWPIAPEKAVGRAPAGLDVPGRGRLGCAWARKTCAVSRFRPGYGGAAAAW